MDHFSDDYSYPDNSQFSLNYSQAFPYELEKSLSTSFVSISWHYPPEGEKPRKGHGWKGSLQTRIIG